MNILLDTNILVFLTRSKNFDDLIRFINPQDALIYVSVVTDAEIRSLALRKNWSIGRIELLENFLSRINIIDVNQLLTQAYVDIDAYSQRENPTFTSYSFNTPRNMGKNDLWIASLAAMLNLTLLTTDADFDHLHGVFFDVRKINSTEFLPFFK